MSEINEELPVPSITCSQRCKNWTRVASFIDKVEKFLIYRINIINDRKINLFSGLNALFVLIGTFTFQALEHPNEQRLCHGKIRKKKFTSS